MTTGHPHPTGAPHPTGDHAIPHRDPGPDRAELHDHDWGGARGDGGGGIGTVVTHRRYVPHAHAHYGGGLVDGAYLLGLFGDAATELCIRTDGDEGLFAAYDDVQFLAPVRAGDVVEVRAELVRAGRRSRGVAFAADVVCRAEPARGPSAASVCDPPVTAARASGTVVVPDGRQAP